MLNKSISLSKQVNKLSLVHKLFFTWAIPHLDDYGLLDNDPEILKATICPLVKEITEDDIKYFIRVAQIPDLNGESLIAEFQDCIEFLGFINHQSISAEKRAKMKFQKIPNNPQENIGKNNIPQESPIFPLNKGREEKGREEKRGEEENKILGNSSPAYFSKIPKCDIDELVTTYDVSEKEIKDKAKKLKFYCESHNKIYKNYRSFLFKTIGEDFKERKPMDAEMQERIRITQENQTGASPYSKNLKDKFQIKK